jgi:hypothetical protein
MFDKVPFTGQTAGMVREILAAAEIVRRLVVEAEVALAGVTGFVSSPLARALGLPRSVNGPRGAATRTAGS